MVRDRSDADAKRCANAGAKQSADGCAVREGTVTIRFAEPR